MVERNVKVSKPGQKLYEYKLKACCGCCGPLRLRTEVYLEEDHLTYYESDVQGALCCKKEKLSQDTVVKNKVSSFALYASSRSCWEKYQLCMTCQLCAPKFNIMKLGSSSQKETFWFIPHENMQECIEMLRAQVGSQAQLQMGGHPAAPQMQQQNEMQMQGVAPAMQMGADPDEI